MIKTPLHKRIEVRVQPDGIADRVVSEYGILPVVARVLAARGFLPGNELTQFLHPSLRDGLPNPNGIKNIDKGIELLAESITSGTPIAVCSDFDVDGLTSSAQLVDFLGQLTDGNGTKTKGSSSERSSPVMAYVPDRFEDGYGLSESIVRRAHSDGAKLIIAVDFGTKNGAQIELARSLGMKTLVIDHHDVGNVDNPADAFINPQQKGCDFANGLLCASGLSWYFIAASRSALSQAQSIDPRDFLDLACLGTICDMVPLRGPNRVIARRGLECLETTKREGLIELKKIAGIRSGVRCFDVSFGLGPRINAAGRIEHGDIVVKLLTTKSSSEATKLAKKLDRLNAERQEVEARVRSRALELVPNVSGALNGIAVWHPDFHPGVIGIVAQRLVEAYYRPAAVMGKGSDDTFKGSVRGIRGVSVVEILSNLSPYLLSYGGHEGAGGFSIKLENIKGFCSAFNEVCGSSISEDDKTPLVSVDVEVALKELSISLVEQFETLAPFGIGNPSPVLLTRQLKVTDVRELRGGHLKAQLSDGHSSITAMMWRTPSHPSLTRGAVVDLAYKLDVNSYLGDKTLQAVIQGVSISN